MSYTIGHNEFKSAPDGTYVVQDGEAYRCTYQPLAWNAPRGIDYRIYGDCYSFVLVIDTDEDDPDYRPLYYSGPCIDADFSAMFDGHWVCLNCRMGGTMNPGEAEFHNMYYTYETCSSCGDDDVPCVFVAKVDCDA